MKYFKLSPDFPEHGGRVVCLGYFDNDLYFCLGSGCLPGEIDKKYLIPIDLQTLERGDWQADHEPLPVTIHDDLLTMIQKCFGRCNADYSLVNEYGGNNYYLIPNVNNLDMTAINFSADNAGKVSGYKFNKLMSKTWEKFTEGNKARYPTHSIRNIIDDFSCDLQTRRNEGTYIKPAKLIRGLFPDLTESQVTCIGSALADALRLRANPDTSGIEVSYKPSEVYIKSSSFSSCMRNQNPCRFQIYDDLEFTGIAYLVEDGELIGRALIHDKVFNGSEGETVKVMDRVYFNNSDTLQTFIAWAQKNGYWYKTEQAASHNVFCAPDNTIIDEPNLYIECGDLTDRAYDEVPYIDTFSYYDKRQEVLHNDCGDFSISTTFRETEGYDAEELVVQDTNRSTCCCCGERMDEDDENYHDGSIYCDGCFNERFSQCYHCGDTTDNDDLTQVHSKYGDTERVCEYCLDNHYVYCSDCEEYYHESKCECVDDEWYCEDCAENHVEDDSDPDEDSETSESLQLEVGKKYVARNGDILTIVRRSVFNRWPWISAEDSHGNTFTFTDSGRCGVDPQYDHDLDLLREYIEPLKLEVGRSYVDRRGVTVVIVENQSSGWPFRGNNEQLYREDGTWYTTVGHECEFDLVKEASLTLAESPAEIVVEPTITLETRSYRLISASDSVANISREDYPAAI